MQDWNLLDDDKFRAEVARFVEVHCPSELRYLRHRGRAALVRPWYQALSAAGWLAPGWPVRYGGMGLSAVKQLIYIEEMERAGAPRIPDQGIMNLGPLLIAHGTDAQRAEYLPKILSGEHLWCQGYSEPNAGSDLASVRTEARLDGDEFVITGRKIWTSLAFDADMMFALVRTDKSVRKQAGLSLMMLSMRQPAITVRPIVNLAGEEELCEVFIDDARTPRRNLIGNLNDGWRLAKTLLGFERIWSGSPRQSLAALFKLRSLARRTGHLEDPVFRDKLTQLELDVLDLASAYKAAVRTLQGGGSLTYEVSLLKVWATETCQRITESILEAAGDRGGIDGDVSVGDGTLDITAPFYDSRAPTIYGGSNQIQRNILARTLVALPS